MSSSSSSDESDEEEKKKFASCVTGYQLSAKDNTASKNSSKNKNPKQLSSGGPMKPSLRECKEDDIEADHIMKTTPEFRNFVSKKLSAYLEEEIEDIKVDDAGKCVNGVVDPGVRLLAKSRSKLNKTTLKGDEVIQQKRPKLLKNAETKKSKKKEKKEAVSSSSSSEEEDERLRSVAVSSVSVLKGTAVQSHKV